MSTTATTPGAEIKVRLYTYKSRRHYGGRDITTTSHVVKARLFGTQGGHQKYIVELLEDGAGYAKGHKIAISEDDFNVEAKQEVSSSDKSFACLKCKKVEQMSLYAVAQTSMGHEVVFTCSCGNKIKIVK